MGRQRACWEGMLVSRCPLSERLGSGDGRPRLELLCRDRSSPFIPLYLMPTPPAAPTIHISPTALEEATRGVSHADSVGLTSHSSTVMSPPWSCLKVHLHSSSRLRDNCEVFGEHSVKIRDTSEGPRRARGLLGLKSD